MKTCSTCKKTAVIKQGNQWLCEKHYRFGQMRSCAKRHGKKVPSREELDMMIPDPFSCQVCNKPMNWRSKDGTSTVATLQHDRAGTMRIICLSCNSRHASFKDDSFYQHDQSKRSCPRCKQSLELVQFCKDESGRWKSLNTYCRTCRTEMHRQWVNRNKERENEKRREYYHRRKASGNPIPR